MFFCKKLSFWISTKFFTDWSKVYYNSWINKRRSVANFCTSLCFSGTCFSDVFHTSYFGGKVLELAIHDAYWIFVRLYVFQAYIFSVERTCYFLQVFHSFVIVSTRSLSFNFIYSSAPSRNNLYWSIFDIYHFTAPLCYPLSYRAYILPFEKKNFSLQQKTLPLEKKRILRKNREFLKISGFLDGFLRLSRNIDESFL